jgi:hypothetical protein
MAGVAGGGPRLLEEALERGEEGELGVVGHRVTFGLVGGVDHHRRCAGRGQAVVSRRPGHAARAVAEAGI